MIADPVAPDSGDPPSRGFRWDSRSLLLRSRTPNGQRVIKILILLVSIAVVGTWWYLGGREVTDDATVEGAIHPVSPRVSGAVRRVLVDDNEVVEAGTLLVELDPTAFLVRLDRANADLAEALAVSEAASVGVPISSTTTESELVSARAAVEDAQAGVLLGQLQVEANGARLQAAEAELRRADAEHDRARKDLDRFRPLLEKDEISKQEFDATEGLERARRASRDSAEATIVVARNEVDIAASRLLQARAVLEQSRAAVEVASIGPQKVSVQEAAAASASARVDQARAAVRQAELELDYTQVKAPAAGVVSRKNVEVGQYVRTGQSLMAVVNPDGVWVVARFKETQLERMRPGQRARIRIDAYSGIVHGRVESIAAATASSFSLLPAQNATGNFVKVVQRIPVKIVLEGERGPERPLRPGMSVVARVSTR